MASSSVNSVLAMLKVIARVYVAPDPGPRLERSLQSHRSNKEKFEVSRPVFITESGLSFFARLQYLLGPKCVGPKSNFWRHGLSLIFAIHAAFLGGVDDDQR